MMCIRTKSVQLTKKNSDDTLPRTINKTRSCCHRCCLCFLYRRQEERNIEENLELPYPWYLNIWHYFICICRNILYSLVSTRAERNSLIHGHAGGHKITAKRSLSYLKEVEQDEAARRYYLNNFNELDEETRKEWWMTRYRDWELLQLHSESRRPHLPALILLRRKRKWLKKYIKYSRQKRKYVVSFYYCVKLLQVTDSLPLLVQFQARMRGTLARRRLTQQNLIRRSNRPSISGRKSI